GAAKESFAQSLAGIPSSPPALPVYSSIDHSFYTGKPGEVAARLAAHLVTPFDFQKALRAMQRDGVEHFVDGSGGRLSRIVTKALGEKTDGSVDTIEAAARPAQTDLASSDEDIAIVALGCLFPGGARDPESYWRMMLDGTIGVTAAPELESDFVAHPLQPD